MHAALDIEGSNTVLYCRRWSATVAFYRDTLGLTPTFENDWFVEFEICSGSSVSIADSSRATIESVGGQGITITWRVRDIEASWAALRDRGVDVTAIAQRWGAFAFYCCDPEGHRLEVWAETPASGGPAQASGRPK